MIALVDCNSFFCSVEKVFHPGLNGKPVCVLSSNDGCIVALTPEAKAVGLKRGDPIFKHKEDVERGGVTVFSQNIMLYAAMSKRVTSILRKSVSKVENYSIDESFCYLDGYEKYYDIEEYMRSLSSKIKTWTDIPVSIGVAPTKTLAKIGSKFAKQYRGYRTVCMIDNDYKRRKALELFPLDDVWGIGRRTYEKLVGYGINTPLEFASKSEAWVRMHFQRPGLQTWKELNGIPCIDTAEIAEHQSITTSRSFGAMVSDIDDLKASVASFAGSCANKLRAQRSVASNVTVFLCSNFFREDLEQYYNIATCELQVPTADLIEITDAALKVLSTIFKPGIKYKKSGVILTDISPDNSIEQILFDDIANRADRLSLSRTIDEINHRYGLKTVTLAVEGDSDEPWRVKSEHRSPNYLTSLDDILTIRI